MLAVYDLAGAPPTWDFATWLVRAEMERARQGAAKLRVAIRKNASGNGFRVDGLPPPLDERAFMLDHIGRPLLRLIGAEPADGDQAAGSEFSYLAADIVEAARAGEAIPLFRPSAHAAALVARWCGAAYITITLREVEYWPARNSQLGEWLCVAKALESQGRRVLFVRDTALAGEPLPGFPTAPWASVDVDLRCALYAGAALNLGVCNGPMALSIYGPAPYLLFKQLLPGSPTQSEYFWRRAMGLGPGEHFPWATPWQRMTWADDGFGEIMSAISALPPAS